MLSRLKRIMHISNDSERTRALNEYAARLGVSSRNGDARLNEDTLIERILKGEKAKFLSCLGIASWIIALGSLITGFAAWAIARNLHLITSNWGNWGEYFNRFR